VRTLTVRLALPKREISPTSISPLETDYLGS
jgi:hypothetical protein